MAKYNVGDVLEITVDFEMEYAEFSKGEKYTVIEVDESLYSLENDDHYFDNSISLVDAHSGFRKVEPKVEFKVGDKVRLLETAHGSEGYSCDTPEKVKERLASEGLDYQAVFEVDQEADLDGDVHVSHAEKCVGLYVLPEFLVPWVEAEPELKEVEVPELKEPFLQHMVIGKTYQSILNELYYRVDQFDFYNSQVLCSYGHEPDVGQNLKSERNFFEIEDEFGVLPPVKPDTQEEPKFKVGQVWRNTCDSELRITEVDGSNITFVFTEGGTRSTRSDDLTVGWTLVTQEDVGGWDREEFASVAPETETVSVDALREAYEYVDHEYLDIEKLIKLAKRLS